MVVQYGERMTCPVTGLEIPKEQSANLAWRRKVLKACDESEQVRAQVYQACSKSMLYWINLFGWTYRPKIVNASGKETVLTGAATHVPFITWKVQDEAILALIDSIEGGHDIAIDKSRDMGATWICLMVFLWFWLFKGNTSFLVLSRKEGLVDRRGSMDSLFEKLRYAIKWLPNWMQPKDVRDRYMHLENVDNGSVIDGESTNKDAGQASRSTATLLDEFARVPDGEAIDVATADTTACRVFNSTPGAPNAHFTRIVRAKRCKLMPLPWWRHPEKGKGLFLIEGDKVKGKGAGVPVPPEKPGYKWVSPWYVIEDARRSKRNVAQNLDMEHGRVGDMVFDADAIEKHRAAFGRDPERIGVLRFPVELAARDKKALLRKLLSTEDKSGLKDIYLSERDGTSIWRFWIPFIAYEYPDRVSDSTFIRILRPDQDDRYIFGIDISGGTGASNSVVSVKSHKTGKIVAKWWDAYTTPEQLAELVVFAAAWFGGRKPPYVVFEKNGPGMQFGKKVIEYGYSAIYYQTDEGRKGKFKTKRWGWHSSPQRKELLVGEYRDALVSGRIINPCNEALDEALDYVFDDAGRVVPGAAGSDENSGATATHGDQVIADALTVLGSADLPREIPDEPAHVPHGTHASRREQARRQADERRFWEG